MTSKDLVAGLASSGGVLFVILATIRLFAPLIMAHAREFRCHDSQPYVSREQTPVLYILIFSFSGVERDAQMARILPAVDVAVAILALMSAVSSPSALNRDPRYLKSHTLSIGNPSQNTYCLRS